MITITAPEELTVVGRHTFLDVEFVDGVAEVEELHPIRAQALEQHGYTLSESAGAVPSEDEPGGVAIVDLNDLTKAELVEVIGDRAEIPARASKPQLVEIAAGLPAEPIPGSIDNGDGSFTMPATGEAVVEATPSLLSEASADGASPEAVADVQDLQGAEQSPAED